MQTRNYTVGRGKLYFNPFLPKSETPTGEMYLGNTPSITETSTYQDLPHYTSDQADRVLDDDFTLQTDRNLTFTCDNISSEILGIMYGSAPIADTVAAGVGDTETLEGVVLGRYYQLGVSDAHPEGIGTVANVVVEIGASVIAALDNFEVDLVRGRIHVLEGAPDITDGDDLDVTYDRVLQTRTLIVEEGTPVEGALRYIADNPKGTNKDRFWPHVKLQPTGDFALKGETWQTISFAGAVIQPADGRKRIYITDPTGA